MNCLGNSYVRSGKGYRVIARAKWSRLRVTESFSGVVKKAVFISAVSMVTWDQSSVSDEVLPPAEHGLRILRRIVAAARGSLDPKPINGHQ